MQQGADDPAGAGEAEAVEDAAANTETEDAGIDAASSEPAPSTGASAPGFGEPLIAGPESVLWAGGLAILFITVFVLLLITRGQARRGAAGRGSGAHLQSGREVRGPTTDFFQPAGAEAEITFDEEPLATGTSRTAAAGARRPTLSPADIIDAPFAAIDSGATQENPASPEKAAEGDAQPAAKKARRRWFSREPKGQDQEAGHAVSEVSADASTEDEAARRETFRKAQERSDEAESGEAEEEAAARLAAMRAREEYERLERARLQRQETAGTAQPSASTGPALFAALAAGNQAFAGDAPRRTEPSAPAPFPIEEALKRETGAIGDTLARQLDERFNALATALEERLNAAPAGRLAPDRHPLPTDTEHTLAAALSTVEEALHAQSETLRAETENLLAAFASKVEARIEALARSVPQATSDSISGSIATRLAEIEARPAAVEQDARALAAAVTALGREFANHRDAVTESLTVLRRLLDPDADHPDPAATNPYPPKPAASGQSVDDNQGVDRVAQLGLEIAGLREAFADFLAAPAEDAAGAALLKFATASTMRAEASASHSRSPRAHLAEIVANALPPSAFAAPATLEHNRQADCLVMLPAPPGPIAIDASFPIEAFAALHQGRRNDRSGAENDFHRAALRHIVDVAEKLIAPGRTAECALIFLPSDTMYSELRANFPVVIDEARRAGVRFVSPTNLTAAVEVMHTVLQNAEARRNIDVKPIEAVGDVIEADDLRKRLDALQRRFEDGRSDLKSIVSAAEGGNRPWETPPSFGRGAGGADAQARKLHEGAAHEPAATAPANPFRATPFSASDRPFSQPDDRSTEEAPAAAPPLPFPLR